MKEHCKEIAGALKEAKEGTLLEVTVQPGSRREGIEISDGSIIVRVREPPSEGRANEALLRLFKKKLKLKVEIVAGAKSRRKELLVRNASPEQVAEALCRALA